MNRSKIGDVVPVPNPTDSRRDWTTIPSYGLYIGDGKVAARSPMSGIVEIWEEGKEAPSKGHFATPEEDATLPCGGYYGVLPGQPCSGCSFCGVGAGGCVAEK